MHSKFERELNANRNENTRMRTERGVTFAFGAIKDSGPVRCSRLRKFARTGRELGYENINWDWIFQGSWL